MEASKNQDHHDEIADKNIKKETLEVKNKEQETTFKGEINENKESKNNLTVNITDKGTNKLVEVKKSEDSKKAELNTVLNKSNTKIEKNNSEITKEKTDEDIKSTVSELNTNKAINKTAKNIDKSIKEVSKEKNLEEPKKDILTAKSNSNVDKNNAKEITGAIPVKAKSKPVKEPPIEKKPFLEFVNDYLIPEIKNEFKLKGKEVNKIYLQKTNRPIAEDICWVIYCEINDTCNFWLSFEKDDITSLKSFSLCKNYEKPSIIESFLIDEKKITLKLIVSRILQRLNGQKLIGAN